jgi:hypothetical protein
MTTAHVRTPSATSARPGRWSWRGAGVVRLAWLHLRSRRVPTAVLALAFCAAVLRAALGVHWTFVTGHYAQQLPMIVEAGAASAIVVTTHSPFGETERATGRWLPYLRLGVALLMTGLAIAALQAGAAGMSLNGGVLQMARTIIGITGIGLLSSLVTGGLLAWILPVGYVAFAEYALLQYWNSPWTWPARPPADHGAWICACLVYAAGLIAFTVRGARTRLADSG